MAEHTIVERDGAGVLDAGAHALDNREVRHEAERGDGVSTNIADGGVGRGDLDSPTLLPSSSLSWSPGVRSPS